MDIVPADILTALRDLGGRVLVLAGCVVVIYITYRLVAGVARRLVARAAVPLPSELALPDEERATRVGERQRRLDTLTWFGLRLLRWSCYGLGVALAVALVAPGVWTAIGGLGVGFGVAIGGAIGFGAQQLVRDYLAGALILGENPYSVGDIVAIAGVRGTVEEVGLRRTVIRDADGTVHSVPNGAVTVASNFTRTFARINERILVAFGTDIDLATRLIDEAGRAMTEDPDWANRIIEAPAVLRVESVADPGIPILVMGVVRPGEQWAVAGELRRRILTAFAASGVELATSRRLIVDGRGPLSDPTAPTDADGAGGTEFT